MPKENREIYPVDSPTPCFDKNGRAIGWFNPRFLCTAIFVFAWSETANEWCVLGSIRGEGSESFQGLMNCPCGYMDINITAKENAVKELAEECGVRVRPEELHLYDIEDEPSAYQQHITLRYSCELCDVLADDITFSHENNEVDKDGNLEVGEIGFIPLSEVKNFKWAFNHEAVIMKIAKKEGYLLRTNWKLFKNKIKNIFNF